MSWFAMAPMSSVSAYGMTLASLCTLSLITTAARHDHRTVCRQGPLVDLAGKLPGPQQEADLGQFLLGDLQQLVGRLGIKSVVIVRLDQMVSRASWLEARWMCDADRHSSGRASLVSVRPGFPRVTTPVDGESP